MGAPRPARGPLWPVLVLALGSLALQGCDELLGRNEASEDPTPAKAEPPAPQAGELQAQQAAAPAQPAEHAAQKGTKEAQEVAPLEAQKAAQQADQSQPLRLSDITVNGASGGLFGRRSGAIEVLAKATVSQALDSSTYVHVKSLCKKDDLLVADVGYLNAGDSKPLEKHAVGEQAEIRGTLYTQGLDATLSPCQFEFRMGGISGGPSIPVGEACWSGSEAAEGRCEPPLTPVAMSGAGKPVEVGALKVERGGGLGGKKGLELSYLLQINETQDSSVRLTFKSACRLGGKSFVDMSQANLMAGPFEYESGESVARTASLYWSSSFDLAGPPNDCDITTSLWKTKAGTFGEYEEERIASACFKDGSLRDGRCDPGAPPSPPATPLAAESVTVDDVELDLVEPHGVSGKFQLKIQADVTVLKPVGQNDGATAKVSCKAGKDTRVESAYLFGPELYYLGSGETARMTANAFGSHALEVKPRTCKVEFFGGPRFSPSGADGVDLGTFCLKKDKVKKGGRC